MIGYPVFLDTEFSGWSDSQLLSIGLVDQSGNQSFYAEISGFDIRDCSDFVRFSVLPLFQGGGAVMAPEDAATAIRSFFEAIDVPEIVVCCDLPSYDWFLFKRLCARGAWPANLATHAFTFDPGSDGLPRHAREAACAARERYFDTNPMHHALQDARALRQAWIAALDCGWHPGAVSRM